MKVAFLLIATNARYRLYAESFIKWADIFVFPHDTLVWSDGPITGATKLFRKEPLGIPDETLHRYHTFLEQEELLRTYDYLFYSDVDMRFVARVSPPDVLSDGITATLHPGFVVNRFHPRWGKTSTTGTPERREQSTAFIPREAQNRYFCGGFNGGTAAAYLGMAHKIRDNVDVDKRNGITAVWHDESHLNKFLYDNPPAKILNPSYCYPEGYDGGYGWSQTEYRQILIAVNKGKR